MITYNNVRNIVLTTDLNIKLSLIGVFISIYEFNIFNVIMITNRKS